MVKVSETIICQRFVQNAWKKDLCSNCFKSKEDHAVVTEKKICYRWTSHVNNFPQHGILKDRQKDGNSKARSVSFHAEETEIIGFGGEDVSSDDEYYPILNEDTVTLEADTEEDKAFRKLTLSNTDFNSVPANLKCDLSEVKTRNAQDAEVRVTYSNLKLGKPLTDADGHRQTLQVSVEPFRDSSTVNGTLKRDGSTRSNETVRESDLVIEKTDKNTNSSNSLNNGDCNIKSNSANCSIDVTNKENNNKNNNNCDIEQDSVRNVSKTLDTCNGSTCNSPDRVNFTSLLNGEVTETVNEANIYTTTMAESGIEMRNADATYSPVSNVPVDPALGVDGKRSSENDVAENMKNAKTMLEPLFRLNGKREEKPKLSIYQSSVDLKEKRYSTNKDCNPINLPLIMSKELEIELDKPGSREMVGEPDGKADSDDSYDPLKADEAKTATTTDSGLPVNPQRSFLHAFKPKPATKPPSLETTPMKTSSNDSTLDAHCLPQTPKTQGSFSAVHNTGSTKRQAPKPPSPKSMPSTPMLAQSVKTPMVTASSDLVASEVSVKKADMMESPLMNGTRDAICFLGENGPSGVKRRLHLESTSQRNRNSVCVSMTPCGLSSLQKVNGFSDKTSESGDTTSISSSEYIYQSTGAIKCTRSLSCDSISPSNGLSNESSLPEKMRKYSGTTIKMKSTLKKFLRLNNKEDEKSDHKNIAVATPRRRIEIIHPLDLNKSSIEILRPQVASDASEEAKKKQETSESPSSTVPESTHTPCSTARPNKPPPPPRNQSLDQKLVSEISKPVRPPPPKAVPLNSASPKPISFDAPSNVYENLGESRQNIAPAKPQRASSLRDRARQTPLLKSPEENSRSIGLESEAIPECDRLRLQHHERQLSDNSDKPSASSATYCGSETESDLCYQSITSSATTSSINEMHEVILLDSETRKTRSVVHNNMEDNYGAIVIVNHEALSAFVEQVNQTALIPVCLKTLQTTLHIRFEHFNVVECSRVSVSDWHFYNAKWAGQDVVISFSNKHLGPTKSLPSWITLYPLLKFNDVVPSRYIKEETTSVNTNAYITVWNEERIESLMNFCERYQNAITFSENGLLLMQLMNALKHLQACGIEDISLDEVLVCKRESDTESKLVLPPMTVDCAIAVGKNNNKQRMSLCTCATAILNALFPNQPISDVMKKILSDERAASLSQAKAVAEYWLWGPYNATLSNDRQSSLQRWLDLERATYLHKMICKKPQAISLNERCQMIFLVRTNAKSLTEASYLLEKSM